MFDVRIHLDAARRWSSVDGGAATGSAFRGGALLEREALARYVAGTNDSGAFEATLDQLNGFFAVIRHTGRMLYAAVDHVRSVPLYYATAGERFLLSDDARWLEAKLGHTDRDPLATAEFLLTGYVTGGETLNPRINQLQAGEMLVVRDTDSGLAVSIRRYFEFVRTELLQAPAEELKRKLAARFDESVQRLLELANGRQLVIPLSGGYDSRLIAALVKRFGYERVRTFTYGRAGNAEAKISQDIARALEFEWTYVPYDPGRWRDWFATPERAEYFELAHGLTSVPHIQDWPAVWQLREQGLLDEDAIFVPGHTGDFISGGHTLAGFAPEETYAPEQYAQAVTQAHYRLWRPDAVLPDPEALCSRIWSRSTHEAPGPLSGLEAIALHDKWDWQERQAKFIVNSLRVYEYWGYDWWMPMWDKEFVRFWQNVPLQFRQDQMLYVEYVTEAFASVVDWDIQKAQRTDRDALPARLVAAIKGSPLLPKRLLRRLRNRVRGTAPYRSHPMAWFGLVPTDEFAAIYDGTQSINSLLGAYLVYGSWQAPEPIELEPRSR